MTEYENEGKKPAILSTLISRQKKGGGGGGDEEKRQNPQRPGTEPFCDGKKGKKEKKNS